MSDLFGNHIVGFPTRRLICLTSLFAILCWFEDTFHQFIIDRTCSFVDYKLDTINEAGFTV